MPRKFNKHKFNAVAVEYDGIRFDCPGWVDHHAGTQAAMMAYRPSKDGHIGLHQLSRSVGDPDRAG